MRSFELAENDLDRFAEIPEAAARLCIHPDVARRWVREGRFPIPVRHVGAKQVVSLRLLVEYINAPTAVAS